MTIDIGISSCPNDIFMFDAIFHKKIDLEDLDFNFLIVDVEELNKLALNNNLDVTKLSFNAFRYCIKNYILLDSGSAIGRNCGPLLISKRNKNLNRNSLIAIPGEYTTANFLFDRAYPYLCNKKNVLFSEIEREILIDNFDAGVIIHENRFTYIEKGLYKVKDLGEFWEEKTGMPIPLGGIVCKRNLPYEVQKKIEKIIRNSIIFAFDNKDSSFDFIRSHSQEMKKDVIFNHINTYVNDFSISLGSTGRSSIKKFLDGSIHNNQIFL
tara:strand:- start:11167 stop:11967 length:801 start_codon:yes stop_codon:yes gene_type:complete